MKSLKSRFAITIFILIIVASVIVITVTATGGSANNPGKPFEQLEAKLDKLEAKIDLMAKDLAKLKDSVNHAERKIVDVVRDEAIRDIAAIEAKLDKPK